jgi:hypothetical protein
MTIGNLPKSIRRRPSHGGHILIGYLPTTKLEHITNKAARRRTIANLFHSCMRRILRPLKTAGVEGVPMASGDGVFRRAHPLYATFVGDYPEQVLVTAVKNGDCPKCDVPHDELGSGQSYPLRDLEKVLDALSHIGDPLRFSRACRAAGIKPIYHPFWEDLPYVNIFQSITPDILHQLYQGVIKHIVSWITDIYGAAEIDARCQRLPPNHNVRIFSKGITTLSRVTGREHNQICRILLALIIDAPLPGNQSPARLICAVRAMLDFLHLAQYPLHSTETLACMKDALDQFHDNKKIFLDLGIHTTFAIPKLHGLDHYMHSIKLFGTTDNYNTEFTERLHIDLAKDAYRATNHKDEYPQMTIWLERKEKILQHHNFIQWRLNGNHDSRTLTSELHPSPPVIVHERQLKMPRHPTLKAVTLEKIVDQYGAPFFRDALARFIVETTMPTLTARQIEAAANDIFLNFRTLPVYHTVKFWNENAEMQGDTVDSIHVRPSRRNKRLGCNVPGRFDTVLVNDGNGKARKVQGGP